MRVTTRVPVLALGLSASLVLAGVFSAAAAQQPFRLTGLVKASSGPSAFGGVRLPTGRVAVLAPSYYVLRADGSGTFSLQLEALGPDTVAAIEVAVSDDGREELLAVGVPTAESQAWFTDQLKASSGQAHSFATGPASPAVAAVWRAGHGFFSTFWTDPLGITVNSVIDEARWQYNGSNVSSLTGNDGRQWLSGNGWAEISHSIGAYYNAGSTVGTVWTNDNFRTSSWFPLPTCGTTNTYYQANNVYGFADGHVGGGVNTWATGGCTYLLSYTAFASPGT